MGAPTGEGLSLRRGRTRGLELKKHTDGEKRQRSEPQTRGLFITTRGMVPHSARYQYIARRRGATANARTRHTAHRRALHFECLTLQRS